MILYQPRRKPQLPQKGTSSTRKRNERFAHLDLDLDLDEDVDAVVRGKPSRNVIQ